MKKCSALFGMPKPKHPKGVSASEEYIYFLNWSLCTWSQTENKLPSLESRKNSNFSVRFLGKLKRVIKI